MRTPVLFLTLILVLPGCSSIPFIGGGGGEPEVEELGGDALANRLMDDFVEAWNDDDLAEVRAMFDDDAVVLIGDERLRGLSDIDRNFIRYNFPIVAGLRVETLAEGAGAEIAFHTGQYTQRVESPGEASYTQRGRQTLVWERIGGEWRITSMLIAHDDAR